MSASRPLAAREHIREARAHFRTAERCAADCRLMTGEPAPQSVADHWRREALRMAQSHRQRARQEIVAAWPSERRMARLRAGPLWRVAGVARRAA